MSSNDDDDGNADMRVPQMPAEVPNSTRDRVACQKSDDDEQHAAVDMLPIIEALRTTTNLDLSDLRPSMLRRRVSRRMALLNIDSVTEYAARLVSDTAEARSLSHDTMIGVTRFFRDPDAFERLRQHLAADLLRRTSNEPFRIWVPACSTGQEVYSLAMLVYEVMESSGVKREIKIFATDIDEDALGRASRATYHIAAAAELDKARVDRFFRLNDREMTVVPLLREMVIYAKHNIVRDPPFTRIDLASVRNVLIYLTPRAQETALASLLFALRQGGVLFLGSAETPGRLNQDFEVVDARYNLFTKSRNAVSPSMRWRVGLHDPATTPVKPLLVPARDRDRDMPNRQMLELIVDRDQCSMAVLSPDGVLTDVVGDPIGIFHVPKGRATNDVVRLLDEPLLSAVSTGLQRLRRGEDDVQCMIEFDDLSARRVTMRLARLRAVGTTPDRVLLTVEPARPVELVQAGDSCGIDKGAPLRIRELQLELSQTRESLQCTIEELQSTNEEQQSTIEELIASNDELQSSNEELQSLNEELSSVNTDRQGRIQELATLAEDLNNLLRNINVGILFLDSELRVRKFTPAIDQVVKLLDHDVGRPIEHFAHTLGPDFSDDARTVLETGQPLEREARSSRGSWLLVCILPYLTQSGKPSGVVATFFNITPIKNANEMTRAVNTQLAHVNEALSNQREELQEMFSIVAHDLKRPVLALDGLLTLIQGAEQRHHAMLEPKPQPDDEQHILERAKVECARMRQMLLDLEGIAGIQHRQIVREIVSVQSWMDELISRFRVTAETKGVRINCACDTGTIKIARTFLEEVIVNLIENALKYGCTSHSPRIDITGRLTTEQFEFSVSDNGKGIAKENHHKIFEPFRRLEPDAAPGSGVGLLAVKRLVQRLDGVIALDSAPQQGAKFTVRVPREDTSEIHCADLQSKTRVLLVEDDLLDARSIERCLRDSHEVTRVQEISAAELKLKQEPFDVILLDLSLPDGHGFELVNHMQTRLVCKVPVVIITGHGDGLTPSTLDAMIGAYITKSEVSRERLLAAISQAMSLKPASPPIGVNA